MIRQPDITGRQTGAHLWSRGVCLALLTMVCGGTFAENPPADADADGGPGAGVEVELHDGLLSLSGSGAPLADVIREIGNAAGFETLVYGELRHQVTRSMSDVPLEEALGQLLQGVSHVMKFDRSATPDQVRLYGTGVAGGVSAATTPETPEPVIVRRALDSQTVSWIAAIRDEAAQGDLDAREDLARLLREDADPAVRSKAAVALGDIGDPAVVSALRIGTSDSEQIVRVRTIRALAAVKDDQSIHVLADVLFSHPDTRTRLLAVWALRQHDSPLARSYLKASSMDGNTLVRQAVARPRHEARPAEKTGNGPSEMAEAEDGKATDTPSPGADAGTDGKDQLSGAGNGAE